MRERWCRPRYWLAHEVSPRVVALAAVLRAANVGGTNLPTGESVQAQLCQDNVIEIDATAQDCNCSACEVFGSTFLVDKCCSSDLRGLWATLLAFEKDELWRPRLQEFSACTGARVVINYNPTGEEGMEAALRQDVGVNVEIKDGAVMQREGAGIYDGYIVQAPWLPAVTAGLENLSPWIAKTQSLNWLDINSMSRQSVSFNNTVRALPLDVDYVAIGWRQDVFDAHGKHPPETMEELAELSEYFNGKDHNGDGEPDWGFCLTPKTNYLMAFVAPFLQMTERQCRRKHGKTVCDGKQTGQNVFFNVSTFEPFVRNPGFRRAVELFVRLVRSSNCPEQMRPANSTKYAIGKCDRLSAFRTGKCAGVISMPGTLSSMLKPWDRGGKNSPQPRRDASGEIVWEPRAKDGAYWGRRALFPGTYQVLDPKTGTLRDCDSELCPKAIPHSRTGRLVNFAPFFAEGGESYAIRATSSWRRKNLMWTLFSWLSTLPATELPLSGVYRESQIMGDNLTQELVREDWPKQMADDIVNVSRFLFLDPAVGNKEGVLGNAAMDLLLLGFSEYMKDLDRILIQDFVLSGKVLHADRRQFPGELYETQAESLVNEYNKRTEEYGWLQQIARWRESLDLPFMSRAEICTALGHRIKDSECHMFREAPPDWAVAVLLPLGAVAFMAVVLLLGGVMNKVLHELRMKRKLEEDHQSQLLETIRCAEDEVGKLGYPMVVTQARHFVHLGALVRYEELRDRGQLVYLDSLEKAINFKATNLIVFMSHQWLGWTNPDPQGVHYNAMRRAVMDIIQSDGQIKSLSVAGFEPSTSLKVTEDNLYCWCDYLSIAQDHRPTQIMAVSSLPMYSSIADVFVIIAPPAMHVDSGKPCNIDTYNSRGWCRAEMLSKVCGTGLKQMFLSTASDHAIEPMTEVWLDRLEFKVFHGEFSCCCLGHPGTSVCDKQNLVRPMLGLYSLMLRKRQNSGARDIFSHIDELKDEFFPKSFVFSTHYGVSEKRDLFGPLISMMEQHVLQSDDLDFVVKCRSIVSDPSHRCRAQDDSDSDRCGDSPGGASAAESSSSSELPTAARECCHSPVQDEADIDYTASGSYVQEVPTSCGSVTATSTSENKDGR